MLDDISGVRIGVDTLHCLLMVNYLGQDMGQGQLWHD